MFSFSNAAVHLKIRITKLYLWRKRFIQIIIVKHSWKAKCLNNSSNCFASHGELEVSRFISTLHLIVNDTRFFLSADTFTVQLEENAHTRRLVLQGTFTMTVTPETLAIVSQQHNSYEWSLHMLKRFHVQKDAQRPDTDLLIIECGP